MEQGLEKVLQLKKAQTDRTVELHQQVNVAIRSGFVACDRSEQAKATHAVPAL
jgi:hypothetical protein